jgi:hypothetical protein
MVGIAVEFEFALVLVSFLRGVGAAVEVGFVVALVGCIKVVVFLWCGWECVPLGAPAFSGARCVGGADG